MSCSPWLALIAFIVVSCCWFIGWRLYFISTFNYYSLPFYTWILPFYSVYTIFLLCLSAIPNRLPFCFHAECVSEWFYQGCVERDSVDPKSFNCPECRQDHFLSSDRNSNSAAQPRDISDIVEKEQENFVEKPVNIAYNSNAISSPVGPTDCDASSSEKKKQSDGGSHSDRSTLSTN